MSDNRMSGTDHYSNVHYQRLGCASRGEARGYVQSPASGCRRFAHTSTFKDVDHSLQRRVLPLNYRRMLERRAGLEPASDDQRPHPFDLVFGDEY